MLPLLIVAMQASAVTPPAEWQTLPRLPLREAREQAPQIPDFVRDEVREGRCVLRDDMTMLDLAVLVSTQGQVRRIVPRAIGCPTVEQFAAGTVLRAARGNIIPPAVDTWFRWTVPLPRP
ncbi:hypothetical protein [Sphingomonas endophytica]|nr:hypothetical protein [Sphingomonas endophytica]